VYGFKFRNVNSLFVEEFCPRAALVVVVIRSRGFLIDQSVRTAFLRAADTAGTGAHTTYGESINHHSESIGCLDRSFCRNSLVT
jgi:hypothetical protein